jgi:hypothetical protein
METSKIENRNLKIEIERTGLRTSELGIRRKTPDPNSGPFLRNPIPERRVPEPETRSQAKPMGLTLLLSMR